MRNVFFLFTVLMVFFIAPTTIAEENAWDGPTFKLESLDGNKLTETEVFCDGNLYLVDFWASWCRPCQQYLPHLTDMVETYGDRGLKVVLFCVDDAGSISTARTLLSGQDYPFTILFDPETTVRDQLGVRRIPTTILFSPAGEELWRHVGYEAGVENDVAEQIETFLPEEEED